jgi:D-glycero-alpha-D-manno-heptose-7-phosphate kinase
LQNRLTTKLDLARGAVHVERDLLGENGGVQDQYHAAFGGINRFDFTPNGTRILPLQITGACLAALTGSLFLLHSGTARYASAVLGEQIRRTTSGEIDQQLSHLIKLTDQAVDVLQGDDPERMLLDLGQMLHEGWETKKRLSPNVSGPQVDNLYLAARAAGAAGGKLCGAGSGGFMLVLVSPERQARFREIIGDVNIVRVGLDTLGSAIISNGDHH